VAVEAFAERRIRFGEIASVIDATLKGVRAEPADEVDHILAAEDEARACALSVVAQLVS
jgi:1-deoxy-D-xylulose-5-phosphate reductoisomerase